MWSPVPPAVRGTMGGHLREGRSHAMALSHVSGTAPAKSDGTAPGRRRFGRWLLTTVAVLVTAATVMSGGTASAAPAPLPPGAGQPDFGPNVKIFDPAMPLSEIQATVD